MSIDHFILFVIGYTLACGGTAYLLGRQVERDLSRPPDNDDDSAFEPPLNNKHHDH